MTTDKRLMEGFRPIKATSAELSKVKVFRTCIPPARFDHMELRMVPGACHEMPVVALIPAVPNFGKGGDV